MSLKQIQDAIDNKAYISEIRGELDELFDAYSKTFILIEAIKKIDEAVRKYLSTQPFVPLHSRTDELLSLQDIEVDVENLLESPSISHQLALEEAREKVIEKAEKLVGSVIITNLLPQTLDAKYGTDLIEALFTYHQLKNKESGE